MIEFAPLRSPDEFKWVADRANCVLCEDTKGIIAYRDNSIVAGVILDSWSYNSVIIHVAIEDPLVLRYNFKEEVMKYVFEDAGRSIIIGITPADNEKALKFNRHIGFAEIYRIRDGHKHGIDYVVQELRKEDYNGQEIQSAAA